MRNKVYIFILVLLVPYFSQKADGQDSTAVNYLTVAEMNNKQGNWEEALRNYLKAVAVFTKLADTSQVADIINIIGEKYYNLGIFKKSAEYFEQEFRLYAENENINAAESAEKTAMSFNYLPNDSLASKWFLKAATLFERISDTAGYLRCTDKLVYTFINQGRFDEASVENKKLLSYYIKKTDYKKTAEVLNQSGYLLFKKGDYSSSLAAFQSAVESSNKAGKDDYFLTDVYTNIAICYQNTGNKNEMLKNFENALKSAGKSGREYEIARINHIIALIHYNNGDNYHAEVYCLECIESAKRAADYDILQICYKDYSSVLEKGNDFIKALEFYEKHLSLKDSLNFINKVREKELADLVEAYEAMEQRLKFGLADEEIKGLEIKTLKAESERRENELKLLMKERELDVSEKDRLAKSLALEQEKNQVAENAQKVRSLQQQQKLQEFELKQKNDEALVLQKTNEALEKDKLLKETELKNEKFARKMAVWLGILMILVALVILFSLFSSRKKNMKLAESKKQIEKINTDLEIKNSEVLEQNEKIIQQKEIIEHKNQSITDSIQYASRIQNAVLPPVDFISEWGKENFILYRPKDIVSGDFYWGLKKDQKIIIAAGDCTGHGVPGAFMSMLGHAFLDEIVNTTKIENAAMILNLLRDGIINTLKQKGSVGETRDGMDISLLILDPETGNLDFAGANNPLYLIRDGKLIKIQGDRMPIGIHFTTLTPFTNQVLSTQKGDNIYIFSDGFADQFGGPKGKKFMYKPFQDLLLSISDNSMETQKLLLNDTFESWKGERDQVDDVLVIGLRI
jgi:serine phosphatase RsbU (regulator of sigma subunit)